ncbi:MAG TPA: proton-conducting transporter membrane subunit [Gemmataceae bacterium]|jgi:hydrogenase-4 component B|nr:proton-conducting transporter membrane subunit [Gemmataceae bacterium]
MSVLLALLAIGLITLSGIPGLLISRRSNAGQWISTALAALGATIGLAGVGEFWMTGISRPLVLPWSLPGAEFYVDIDSLSAFFLAPIFLISLLANIYGQRYWKQSEHPANGRKLRFFFGTMTAGMALVIIARNSFLFLFAWEVMALSGFFVVTTEDEKPEVREAGWIYLAATHAATLSLFALFALLRLAGHSFSLSPLTVAPSAGLATAIFLLALFGFGVKAGIIPLHIWLPSAHASAPSHVSAMMSGVLIKMGIYGLVRITSLLPNPPAAWGGVVLALGVISGVLGVAFAIGQHDLKRLLAYHSIENIGIIVMGLGLALLGRTLHRPEWIVLGLGGALLHVWNHALFKPLLFLSAGSVIHASQTREIDHLGGLAKAMPRTALCFLVGAVAICGLPPLNGFVSEFLIYLGLFRSLIAPAEMARGAMIVAFAAPALALIGALAVACFVKVFGAVFLGSARSEHAIHAHESPKSMLGPMAVLVICCIFIGLMPSLVAPILDDAIRYWEMPAHAHGDTTASFAAPPALTTLAPFQWISRMGLLLIAAMALGAAIMWWRLSRSSVAKGPTWGCGYVAPTARMQYTSSSFAQMLVSLFGWALRPKVEKPKDLPFFPHESSFHSHVPETVLDQAVLPSFRYGAWLVSWFRLLQQGSIQSYLMYIFVALIALMLWRW